MNFFSKTDVYPLFTTTKYTKKLKFLRIFLRIYAIKGDKICLSKVGKAITKWGEMGHFYKLLCEEMIFLLHKGKNDGLRYEVIIFSHHLCINLRTNK